MARASASLFAIAERRAGWRELAATMACGRRWTIGLGCLLLITSAEVRSESPEVDVLPIGAPEVIRDLEFARIGDETLRADLYRPPGLGPYPGVMLVHGGAWMSGDKLDMAWHAQRLAMRGYLVLSINYRLAPRFPFPAQLEDCQAALRWWRTRAKSDQLDPQRIAGYGYSAGGHLVCLLGALDGRPSLPTPGGNVTQEVAQNVALPAGERVEIDEQLRLQAVVAGGAPCDFQHVAPRSERFVFWLGGTRRELPEVYRRASPTTHVTASLPPLFMFHGTSDWLVPLQNAHAFWEAAQKKGSLAEWHEVAGKGHMGAFLDSDAFERSVAFLDRRLRDQGRESP